MSDVLSNGLNVNVNIQPPNEPDAGNISITILPPQNGPQGDTGATYTPTVDKNGILSWSNDKNLENPAPVDLTGPKGEQGDAGSPGKDGPQGPEGKSAYEIAKENGFEGSEQEWLDHLRADSDKLFLIQLREEPAPGGSFMVLKHDYTVKQIRDALNDGKILLLRDPTGKVYEYSHDEYSEGGITDTVFRAIGEYIPSKGIMYYSIAIYQNYSAVQRYRGGKDEPMKTPNPKKLNFVDIDGTVKAEYDGSEEATLKYPEDGKDGYTPQKGVDYFDGEPGFSPTVTVTQTDAGAIITATDKNGTTSATVKNGKDGAGGSGSGLPTSDSPHQMLVTDADGNTVWDDRTHYHDIVYTKTDILPEIAFSAEDIEASEGELPLFTPFVLEAGKTYTIKYNGTEYPCVPFIDDSGDAPIAYIGNLKVMDENMPGNDEPFIAASAQGIDMSDGGGIYGMLMPIDGAQEITFSISVEEKKEVLKKLPDEYLPDSIPYDRQEEVVFLPETIVSMKNNGVSTTPFEILPEVGERFMVTFDGTDYECTAVTSTNEVFYTVFGYATEFGGEENNNIPFGIAIFAANNELYEGGLRFAFRVDGSDMDDHTIKVYLPVGYPKRIKQRYLPKSVPCTWVIRSKTYDALMNGKPVPEYKTPRYEELYSEQTAEEIVEWLKSGELGGVMLYHCPSTEDDDGTITYDKKIYNPIMIDTIFDANDNISGAHLYFALSFASIPDDLYNKSVRIAVLDWYAGTNSYHFD